MELLPNNALCSVLWMYVWICVDRERDFLSRWCLQLWPISDSHEGIQYVGGLLTEVEPRPSFELTCLASHVIPLLKLAWDCEWTRGVGNSWFISVCVFLFVCLFVYLFKISFILESCLPVYIRFLLSFVFLSLMLLCCSGCCTDCHVSEEMNYAAAHMHVQTIT